jgi:ribokinase
MVIVFGSINLDLVARVPRIPRPGETLAGTDFQTAPGGKGANQALAARAAGAAVAMYGAVGEDVFADAALVNLESAGVDLHVARERHATGIALINVDDRGENAITVVGGANALVRASAVDDRELGPGSTVLMQLEVPHREVASLAARAHARGARVILNAAPAAALDVALLRNLDVLVVNEHEAQIAAAFAGGPEEFVAHMHKAFGVRTVVTLGARGAVTIEDNAPLHVPSPQVSVVDTTGAGDAFAGALAAALDGGATMTHAAAVAARAGADCCTYRGAQRDTAV